MISIAKPHGDPVPVGSSQMKIGTEDDKRKTPVPLEGEILCQNTEDPMDFWIWLNRRIQTIWKSPGNRGKSRTLRKGDAMRIAVCDRKAEDREFLKKQISE